MWAEVPTLWAALAIAMMLSRHHGRGGLLICVLLLGATRGACGSYYYQQAALESPHVADDRALDTLRGHVSGPIEDGPRWRRFELDTGAARVAVTAAADVEVLPGDLVEVRGRLRTPRGYRVAGAFDRARFARARHQHAVLTAPAGEVTHLAAADRVSLWRWPAALQRRLSAQVAARAPGDAGGVVRAMSTGDRAGLRDELRDWFQSAGVAHVLAVSGLHLALVALLSFAAVRRGWAAVPALANRIDAARVAALVAAPLACLFTLVTGARPSTLRALLVVLLVLAGVALGRRARIIDAVGVAALLLLAWQPAILWDPSFQLSIAATTALALASGKPAPPPHGSLWRRIAMRCWRAARSLLRASAWATAATAPITAASFGTVAMGGVVANLIVVPLTELIIVPCGLLGAMLAGGWAPVGAALIGLAALAADVVIMASRWTAESLPAAAAPALHAWQSLLLLAAVGLAIAATRGRVGWRRALLGGVSMVAVVAAGQLVRHELAPRWADELRVTFVDVGQGDAALVELPSGGVWLIDGGGLPFVAGERSAAERARIAESPGQHAVVPLLRERGIERIDVVILSHPHPDHYSGLRAVAAVVDIGELWDAKPHAAAPPSWEYQALRVELARRGVRLRHPPLGAALRDGDVTLRVLAPRYRRATAADPVADINDDSLVVAIERAGRRILFAGDVEGEGEERLVDRFGDALAADIVKVPHHGSRTSSSAGFVAAVRPRLAVISCGLANRFRFPAAEVEYRWRNAGAQVLRTDLHGSITAIIDRRGVVIVETAGGRP